MSKDQAASAFREGKHLYEHHDYPRALLKFKEAVELDGSNPEYLTTLGTTVSRVQKNYELAEQLCQQAIRKKHNDAQLYLNLASVYRKEGNKEAALDALITGLKYTKRDRRIIDKIHALGWRRPPVLRFLDRENTLNRLLGKIRHVILPLPGLD